ncbi:CGI-121-domain-containing protein [Piromyces finnis]|uniref:EKC/KEOPS complex subunit CGI121 n=1 Tax=Piromyces finnis TaxID=1754191 RepID=A0A1Y1V8Y1_9FUNG|nr:CGI-121-domain-containing protein [Piromyces finnis]|eukprot:ORX50084.1 CGI-121-domain-containing protein [Piromyces finnis]
MKQFELPEIIKPDNGIYFLPNAYISLYNNLKNQKELQEMITANDEKVPNCAVINAHMIIDVFQVLAAASKATLLESQGKLKTNNVNSEIIFSLSPNTKINEANNVFGISKDCDAALVIIICNDDVKAMEINEEVNSFIEGDEIHLSELSAYTDLEKIKKFFKIDENIQDSNIVLKQVLEQMTLKGLKAE